MQWCTRSFSTTYEANATGHNCLDLQYISSDQLPLDEVAFKAKQDLFSQPNFRLDLYYVNSFYSENILYTLFTLFPLVTT